MTETITQGAFAHVTGTFDLKEKTGSIDYVTPVSTATAFLAGGDDRVRVVGLDRNNTVLFDQPANPRRNSCAPDATSGAFEEYVPVSAELALIRLYVDNELAAEYRRGETSTGAITLGAPAAGAGHRLTLASGLAPAPGVTYTVQARGSEQKRWQTIGIGLFSPSTEVDMNQFPGAKAIELRVLQSDGFSEQEVFKETKTF